jgi:hypothetical protein
MDIAFRNLRVSHTLFKPLRYELEPLRFLPSEPCI